MGHADVCVCGCDAVEGGTCGLALQYCGVAYSVYGIVVEIGVLVVILSVVAGYSDTTFVLQTHRRQSGIKSTAFCDKSRI